MGLGTQPGVRDLLHYHAASCWPIELEFSEKKNMRLCISIKGNSTSTRQTVAHPGEQSRLSH